MLGTFITDKKRGKLIMFLNQWTQFSEDHKSKLAKWIFPHKSEARLETKLRLGQKVSNGEELTKEEKSINKKRTVFCPQQLFDGINEALVINALKYSHINIKAIDQELRDKFNLTDFNMAAFDLQTEINKCKK